MTKPSIADQIEAVNAAAFACAAEAKLHPSRLGDIQAALSTLHWVKRHAPTIKSVLGEFEGSTVKPREEE